MILGRERELARIATLVADARSGRAGSLVVVGEPGIGKTAILEAAADREEDMHVLRTRGIESELELPFASLLELLRPLLDRIEALPESQATALRAALALAPPSRERDRFVIAAATLNLLIAAAEERPILALVDDMQWLDQPSRETLAVAARRLRDAPVVLLWSARRGVELGGVETLELEPLAISPALELARAATPDLDPELEQRVLELAAGNPLALVELPGVLERHGATARAFDEPPPGGAAGEHLFGAQFDALPDEARLALLAAAAARTGALGVLVVAWTNLGIDLHAVEPAERAGLVSVEGAQLRFRHPLVRSLTYGRADPPARRRAHKALADALEFDRGDEYTWHRALAALEPDEEIARALEELAARGQTRAAAANALVRAARLTAVAEERSRRLLKAAWAAHETGAAELARELAPLALEAAGNELERAKAEHLLALLEERDSVALDRLLAAAERALSSSAEQAARILVDAIGLCVAVGRPQQGLEVAERARELVPRAESELRLLIALRYLDAMLWIGRPVEAASLAREAADQAEREGLAEGDVRSAVLLAETLYSGSLLDRARAVAERTVTDARRQGALEVLRDALAILFSVEWSAGRMTPAGAAAAEELQLAEVIGRTAGRVEALGHRARIAAVQGREDECRGLVVERYSLVERLRPDPLLHPALGLLELGLGNAEAAVAALERTVKVRRERGAPDAALPDPELPLLIEAYVRAGRLEQAEQPLTAFHADAERMAHPFALALAWRCRGLIDADFDAAFARSLEYHDRGPRAFERARTVLLYGERLRRAKRRIDAREWVHNALATFDELGATLWSNRAQAELAATGERARRREPGSGAELTPQELQVARLVSSGLMNREVAAQLFVSTNTIETHLRHIFQKLGVRSRTELARRIH